MARQPFAGLVAPGVEQIVQQLPVGLHGAVGAERAGVAAGLDEMEAVRCQLAVAAARAADAALPAFAHGLDQLDLADKRRVEGEAVGVQRYLAHAGRHTRANQGVELHDERVLDRTLHGQRLDVGVGGKAAVPVGDAIDLDCMMQGRQARGRQHRLDGQLLAPEDARAARRHLGGGDQKLDWRAVAQLLEVDAFREQTAQRIETERIEFVRRPQAGHLRQRGAAEAV